MARCCFATHGAGPTPRARIPFTPRTLFRMCSITKQFTCAVVLDAYPDPTVLDADVRDRLPLLEQPAPGALHLCHNQSGLRDYWAVAMLHGSPAEAPFGDVEAARVIAGTRTLHFPPGTRHSYVNQNFRMLSDIVQQRAARSFAELLRTRVFDRAGMATALLAADTAAMPDGTQGYEGTVTGGFRAAENRIRWTGDAGLGASLDDMIAWERHIDATRDDPDALYSRLCVPVTFADGTPSAYGFGLNRARELGRPVTAHGGALRGWRSHRLYAPSERVSVVVMFNHLSDAHQAAVDLLAAVLGEDRPARPTPGPTPDWLGAYREPETGLSVRIEVAAEGQVRLRYGHRSRGTRRTRTSQHESSRPRRINRRPGKVSRRAGRWRVRQPNRRATCPSGYARCAGSRGHGHQPGVATSHLRAYCLRTGRPWPISDRAGRTRGRGRFRPQSRLAPDSSGSAHIGDPKFWIVRPAGYLPVAAFHVDGTRCRGCGRCQVRRRLRQLFVYRGRGRLQRADGADHVRATG